MVLHDIRRADAVAFVTETCAPIAAAGSSVISEVPMRLDARGILPAIAMSAAAVLFALAGRWVQMVDEGRVEL